MNFNSLVYLLFLTVTTLVFFSAGRSARLLILLGASLVFYAFWSVPLIGLIILSTLIDFSAGLMIERTEREGARRAWIVVSMGMNLGILGYMKYANFFMENIQAITGGESWGNFVKIALPPGISFYTFHGMSYTIDVYRRTITPTRSFMRFFLYVMYFPQLVAGPIARTHHLLPQFDYAVAQPFSMGNLATGVRMIIWGLFKKVMIADYCGELVGPVFASPGQYNGWALLVATYAFTLQIYCDFSAYSEIALGSARIFGVDLLKNFDQPYLSGNVSEFWRRWHISLSTWFRDYLFIPLGGSQRGRARTFINLVITMFLSGLWHGASWNFVLWGLLHGALLLIHALLAPTRLFAALRSGLGGLWSFTAWFVTFHCAAAGWILFRAGTLDDTVTMLKRIGGIVRDHPVPTQFEAGFLIFTALFLLGSYLRRRLRVFEAINADAGLSILFYALLVGIICLWGKVGGPQFIYFQF